MRRAFLLVLAPLVGLAAPTGGNLAFAATRPAAAKLARSCARHASFDWDDNTVVMTTRMFLRDRRGGPTLMLTTAEWAHAKDEVGEPGPLEHHFLDKDRRNGSFRDFRDHRGGPNLFLRDLTESVESGREWKGPSWDAFVEQLSTREGARRTSLITAREHSAESMYQGLRYLQALGLIKHVPLKKNLFAVNRPGLRVGGKAVSGTTPERKLVVQRHILDGMELAAAEEGPQRWHFSDDDWSNYVATRDELQKDVRAGRWPSIDIKLHFTGLDDPEHPPQTMKLRAPAL